ncbi:MAG: ABC transporter ATP-binding protein [Flavobacteriaceae bacterium]
MVFEIFGIGMIIPVLGFMLTPITELLNEYPFLDPFLAFLDYPDQTTLIIYGISLLIAIYVIKTIFFIFLVNVQSKFGSQLCNSTSEQLFEGYINQSFDFHVNNNSARMIKNIQVESIQFLDLIRALMILIVEITVLTGISFLLILTEPIGALSLIFFFTMLSYLFQNFTKKRLAIWGKKRLGFEVEMLKNIVNGLDGIKDVKVFNKSLNFLELFFKNNRGYHKLNMNYHTLKQYPRIFLEILSVVGLMGLIYLLIMQGKSPIEILPVMGVFAASAFRMMPSFNKIIVAIQTFRFSKPVINELYNEISYFQSIKKNKNKKINRGRLSFDKEIKLTDLSYSYINEDCQILDKLSLTIKKGESIGIVGPSGCGKSTLINIMLGLISPSNGDITCDGKSIFHNKFEWRNIIGYVPQSIFLIDDSIAKNIAFGLIESEINYERVKKVIKMAQLESFVKNLPNKLETIVGERGVKISGGQMQRIGIARSLYREPKILFFDESTSSLDDLVEKEIVNSIESLKEFDITVIMIAHRLSTLKNCDNIYKLNKKLIKKEYQEIS